jgi:hypothetical protein
MTCQPVISPPSSEVPRMSALSFQIPTFESIWGRETPVIVTDVLSKLQGKYDPIYFIQRYGSQSVNLVDCDTGCMQASKVADFFRDFGSGAQRKSIEKLKVFSLSL